MEETVETNPQELSDDAFAMAFEAAANEVPDDSEIEDTPAEPTSDGEETPVEAKEEPAPEKEEKPEGDKPVEEPAAEAKKETPPEPPPAPEAKPSSPPKPDPEAEAAAKKAQQDADDAAAKAAEEAAAREKPTDEEQEMLTQLAEDFPEVSKAFEVIQRTTVAKIENMLGSKLSELTGQFDQRIAPAEQAASEMAQNKLITAVKEKHADAIDLLPKMDEWIAQQPSFLQESYNKVLDGTNADDIITLYDRFKKETGSAQPPAPSPSPEEQAEKAEKEKRLKAQEGVRSRHTSERAAVDPNDFDGAFEKFAAA